MTETCEKLKMSPPSVDGLKQAIIQMEEATNVTVQILGSETLFPEHFECDLRDVEGNLIPLPFLEPA